MQRLSETHHFTDGSKTSIQDGQLMQVGGTPAGSKSLFGRNSTHRNAIRTIGDEAMVVGIATPVIPDARDRIKKRQAVAKVDAEEKKRKLEDIIEVQRAQVLESYNIRTMI